MTEKEMLPVEQCDLIDRRYIRSKFDQLIVAASRQWGVGSTEHNLVRDVCDLIARAPAATRTPTSRERVLEEALTKAREALCYYACHRGPSVPCLRSADQCATECGKPAGDAILAIDAALNPQGDAK